MKEKKTTENKDKYTFAAGQHPALLFVQNVLSGSFDGNVLTFEKSSELVLYFSDRPNRFTGHMTVRAFLDIWEKGKESFKSVPPNAVLSILTDEKVINAVIELFSPQFTKGVFRYNVKPVSGTIPDKFNTASLFIDAFPTAVNSQITDAVTQANTIVNPQITDAVTQANVKVTGDASGALFQVISGSLADAASSAVRAQQESSITAQAATTQGIATLYSIDTAAAGKAVHENGKT